MITDTCYHRQGGTMCPISKTACLGECIYADILDDIGIGIIGLDIVKKEIFFQNKLAIEVFSETVKPKDYEALASVLIPNLKMPVTPNQTLGPLSIPHGRKFIGYSIYIISETYLWIYLSDITEKTRLNAIAEAVNTMNNLGYIFSGIRHELGNPINSIKTTVTVCKKNLNAYSKEMIGEFIERVLSDITRVEVLLKDLKTFSMYENPECSEVPILSFMENLLSIVERDFSAGNIRIKTAFSQDAPFGFFDARVLQHVMLNLLTNAFDALDGIADAVIGITVSRAGDRIVIKVMDNGRGISEEQQKHLFKPFSTTKRHGTGLGLVIVKKMLLKIDGTIEIGSQENAGTTVTMTLPVRENRHA